jgi:type VI secretion system protein ImpF
MSERGAGEVLRHSVLDRLAGKGRGRGDLRIDVQELREAVMTDVASLLNTRRPPLAGLDVLPEAEASLLNYGIPDLSGFAAADARDVKNLIELIASTLRVFETRFDPDSIRVAADTRDDAGEQRMYLRIEAVIHVEPVREPVAFDTEVDMQSGKIAITAAG